MSMSREAWIAVAVVGGIVALVTIVFALRMVFKLVSARRVLGELGTGGKVAFWGALAYTIFPIDLLPDPIYLDDMAVLGGALFYLHKLIRRRGGSLEGAIPHARKVAQTVAARRAAGTRRP
jgi:uncharacterized membrane protein YkvA (DUF1232 family)